MGEANANANANVNVNVNVNDLRRRVTTRYNPPAV